MVVGKISWRRPWAGELSCGAALWDVTLRAGGRCGCGGGDRPGGRVMVEVTVRSVVACQSMGGGDAAWWASGAGPALACRAGEPVSQTQPEEREGGAGPGDQGA
jgi:hypothetical protein